MEKKFVFKFSEGNANQRALLGGKGCLLAEMTNLGLPVPNGFTVSTEACTDYYKNKEKTSPEILKQIDAAMETLEKDSGKKFGSPSNPLLVSVRSGSRASMPGMMDTVLNLGLNDEVCEGLGKLTQNQRFANDCYRRFIQMFSDVVLEVEKHYFEELIDNMKHEKNMQFDNELTAGDLANLITQFKALVKKHTGSDFPQSPKDQLYKAVDAVFKSWNNARAITYRRLNDIPGDWGTAVNVQMMVFGNMGETSGTGVAFTRDPSTGENKLYGEYLMNAQGEDVVAGVRTPMPIAELNKQNPGIYKQFTDITLKLEKHFKDMQDMEFTIENGKLFILQTRNGKRTASAALRIATDLVNEKMITEQEAVLKIDPKQLDALLHPQFDLEELAKAKPIATGLPASPGAACGKVVFTAGVAIEYNKRGEDTVLVRLETSPEDIEGMNVCEGILTARGGMTSHAAVVARGMGTCCVAGCGDIKVKESEKIFICKGVTYKEGDWISLDGATGKVYAGKIATTSARLTKEFETVMKWSDKYRSLKIRTNVDTAADAKQALTYGAEGIGLCRTEHMFFEESRIFAMRQMILSKTVAEREKALAKLLPIQKADFVSLFKEMKNLPVTVRLLDPPLHEFLPHTDAEIKDLAGALNMSVDEVKTTINGLHEFNPMLGHRGCRLAITYPEITVMQTRAIIEAAIEANAKFGLQVKPEIEVPLIGSLKEFKYLKKFITETADKVIKEKNAKLKYTVGTMIETPRACLTADQIAEEAEFFSFGTNDLSQMTFGFSRDDAGKFLDDYYAKNIFESDPFVKIDFEGVGQLMKMTVDLGHKTRKDIEIGICGEQGGDPASVEFCHNIGLNYVSCSPYRVPIARLAAAQAELKNPRKK